MVCKENVTAPEDIQCGTHDGDQKGISNPPWSETGQVDRSIGKPISGIEQIDEERPSAEREESVSDNQMEGRGDRLSRKAGKTIQLGAIKGKQIVQVLENNPRIVEGADQ